MVVPKMRFKTDSCIDFSEWETKRADELFESITDKNHPEDEVLTIIQGHGTVPRNKSGRNIQYDDKGLIGYKRVQKNDFIIHLRSFEGGLEIANENGIVSPAYIILRGKCDIAPGFYNEYFHTNRFINQNLAKAVEGIRDGRQISYNTFCQLNIPYPCIEEQNKIATLFSTLNTVIANCQSEVDAWEKYKRGVMQQLFSQKVRFKADDGSEYPKWEKSNLGSHCEFYNGDRGKNYPKPNDLKREGIPFINAGDLVDGKIALNTANKITKEKYNSMSGAKIKDHDIVYCLRGSIGKNAIVDHLNDGTVASSLVVIRAKDINFKYLFYFLNSDLERKQRVLNDEGCAQPNLSAKNVSNFIIHVPCIEEQHKIADCLSAFDEVIDKAKQKLEAYKQLKKGLLQQMFV